MAGSDANPPQSRRYGDSAATAALHVRPWHPHLVKWAPRTFTLLLAVMATIVVVTAVTSDSGVDDVALGMVFVLAPTTVTAWVTQSVIHGLLDRIEDLEHEIDAGHDTNH